MARHKDAQWNLPDEPSWECVHAALLMDLRDELRRLNQLLSCPNFTRMPETLRAVRANTSSIKRLLSEGKKK